MDIYQPKVRPRGKPIVWGEEYHFVPATEAQWYDGEIRHGMEHAIQSSDLVVRSLTKLLAQENVSPILSITIDRDQKYYEGLTNTWLQLFAHYSYMALADHFEGNAWRDWCIVPYFNNDDMHDTLSLGVFIDEKFNQTVVE